MRQVEFTRLGPKLVRYQGDMWARAKVRRRHVCTETAKEIAVGELAYHPITNAENRMLRIRAEVFDG